MRAPNGARHARAATLLAADEPPLRVVQVYEFVDCWGDDCKEANRLINSEEAAEVADRVLIECAGAQQVADWRRRQIASRRDGHKRARAPI